MKIIQINSEYLISSLNNQASLFQTSSTTTSTSSQSSGSALQSAYDDYFSAQLYEAAVNIADFMTSAQTVNAKASSLLKKDSSTDSADVVKQVSEVVNSYNEMASQAKNASGYMNSAIMKRITNSLNPQQLEQLGIQKGANGQLQLDQAKLGRNLNERSDQTTKALTSTLQTMKKETNRIDDIPASAMLNKSMNKLQLLRGLYNSGSGTSLFGSTYGTSGLLINTHY